MIEAFRTIQIAGRRVLFPRGDRARENVIPAGLSAMGADVVAPVAYSNVTPTSLSPDVLQALEDRRIHCVSFTSSSTVQNLAAMMGENRLLNLLEGVAIASIGPITSQACRNLGLEVAIEPKEYTVAALASEIVTYFKQQH